MTTPQNGWQYCNDPADSQPQSHTISTTYDHGLPVRVSTDQGIFAGYQYHPNGQLERADFSNGTYSILDQGTNGMLRPKRIKFYNPTGSLLFQTGTFAYDGAGNITQIGTDRYIYDAASRLVRGTARTASRWEEYTYDPADNITRMVRNGTSIFDYNIDATKNRLIGSAGNPPDIFYDAGGNLTRVGDAANPSIEIEYDGVGMMSRYWKSDPGNGQSEYLYIYGPENYRIVTFDGQTGERFWELRDQNGALLTQHKVTGWGPYINRFSPGEKWEFEKDYIRGPQGLISTRDSQGTNLFFHQDHLGTARLVTSNSGQVKGRHNYYPFGTQASISGTDESRVEVHGPFSRPGRRHLLHARPHLCIPLDAVYQPRSGEGRVELICLYWQQPDTIHRPDRLGCQTHFYRHQLR